MWLYAFIVTTCIDGYCTDEWVDWGLTWEECEFYVDTHYSEGFPHCIRDEYVED